ncbi:serine/threonine-protein kinase [Streptomyces werraensis]|uniref:serine/threonine-protein kinase n=1 Tax=Streptomyces werraensis TaxID=68284 RepID=UPI001CE363D5
MVDQLTQHDPRRIGPFEVLGRLGAGGMGLVYLARSASGRRVAIKTVRTELAEDQLFRVRFTREVEAARAVSGFYTAAVVDADPRAAVPWLATAYVPAPSLEEIVNECGPLPAQAVRWLAAGVAEALQSIHGAGLVHRDLKPSNVLVVEDGPRVIDFGIASGVSNTRLTMTNVAVGTPAYMSPEQAKDSRSVTGASDVFSLGSMLVFAATGHPPFHGANPVETVFMLLREGPDLEGLPDELRPLIESCMQMDPTARPNPADLQAQLAPHLFGSGSDDSGTASAWLPERAVALIEARRGGRPARPPQNSGRSGGGARPHVPPPPPHDPVVPPPPPPQASARFPDAPPTVGRAGSAVTPPAPSVPPRPAHRPRPDTPSETTTRLRAVPAEPDPALSWSAPMSPGGVPGAGRPASVSSGEPETGPRPFARRTRGQVVAAAVCLVLGTGLIGGAVTGAWLADGPEGPGTRHAFAVAGDLWHEVPVDQLFPPTVQGRGAGPGEADRVWTRIAVAPDSGCEGAFDALLTRVLAPVGCERLLRATYTDATQSHVTTVGLLFTEADAVGMEALARRFERERLDRRGDLMPLPYAAKDTAAEGFGPEQRASWAISVLTDAPVVVYAVSGWADGRSVDEPQPAEDAMRSGATTTAPAQAGLGHEARGLADRFERALRKRAGTPTERPS